MLVGPYETGQVYLGDCIEKMRDIPNNSVDFIFTDPPYGHNNNNGDLASRWEAVFEGRKEEYDTEKEWRPIENDGEEANELVRQVFAEAQRILKPGCCCCCCCCGGGGGGGPDPQFARWSLWLDEAFNGGFKHMVIWDKGPMGMGHHYRRSYETVLVAQKKGAACKWFSPSKDVENIIRPGQFGIKKIIPQANQHPTEKPWELAGHFIRLHTQEGDVVLEPFSGSGSTLYAAHKLGRQFIGFELDPSHHSRSTKRVNTQMAQTNFA